MRIYISLDDKLADIVKKDADAKGITVNDLIFNLVEDLYRSEPFNYDEALRQLVIEAKKCEEKEFTLSKLPSFSKISTAKADQSKIKPSIVRAKLGKMFNRAVADKNVLGVRRKKLNGEPVFYRNSAVYEKIL
jgi:predicted DNA-binding ribbon-helix-helix protein